MVTLRTDDGERRTAAIKPFCGLTYHILVSGIVCWNDEQLLEYEARDVAKPDGRSIPRGIGGGP
jgi:hypothetical protein